MPKTNYNRYHKASWYEDWCEYCTATFDYTHAFGDVILTEEHMGHVACPECGKMIMTCDLCYELNNRKHNCSNCPIEAKEKTNGKLENNT